MTITENHKPRQVTRASLALRLRDATATATARWLTLCGVPAMVLNCLVQDDWQPIAVGRHELAAIRVSIT